MKTPTGALQELLALPKEDFLFAAYDTVMGRRPDPVGFQTHFLSLGDDPVERLEILCDLMNSPEGRRECPSAVRTELTAIDEGLQAAQSKRRFRPITFNDRFCARTLFSAHEVVSVDDRYFPRALVNVVLGREPTFDEAISLSRDLRQGLSKRSILVKWLKRDDLKQGLSVVRLSQASEFWFKVKVALRRLVGMGWMSFGRVQSKYEPNHQPQVLHSQKFPVESFEDPVHYSTYLSLVDACFSDLEDLRVLDLSFNRLDWLGRLSSRGARKLMGLGRAQTLNSADGVEVRILSADLFEFLNGLAPGSVDLVTLFGAFDQLNAASKDHLFRLLHRVLRKRGLVIIETVDVAGAFNRSCDFREGRRVSVVACAEETALLLRRTPL